MRAMQQTLETAAGASAARTNTAVLAAIIVAISGFAFSLGMTYPVIALVLEMRGFSETEIGLNSAVAGVGLLASAFIVPRLAQRISYRLLIAMSAVFGAAILLVMTQLQTFWPWMAARFLMALSVAGLFIGTEAWLSELVEEHRRGLVMGLYASTLSATFALGPLMIPFVDITTAVPFQICAAVVVLSGVAVLPLKRWDVLASEGESTALGPIFMAAPLIMFAILTMGMFEAAAMSLLPIYALERGYNTDLAAWLVSALAVGSFIAQPIIGRLSDYFPVRPLLFVCGTISAAMCLIVPFIGLDRWFAFVFLAVLGGTSFGAYTLSLVNLGRRFRGATLAAAMGCTAIAWGLGGVIGPAVAGPAMDGFGPDALMHVLTILFAMLVVFTIVRALTQSWSNPKPQD